MTYFKEIEKLAEIELEEANKQHPPFGSDHEAWAVIKQELEECEDEMDLLEMLLDSAWTDVRTDEPMEQWLVGMRKRSINLAAEAIQVAAMCEKGLKRYDAK